MDLEKLKRIKNLIIAKILFVFGWIYDLCLLYTSDAADEL